LFEKMEAEDKATLRFYSYEKKESNKI